MIKIKCIKNARDEKTIYQDLNGEEIELNDGNTWINICPTDANIVIEPEEVEDTSNTEETQIQNMVAPQNTVIKR